MGDLFYILRYTIPSLVVFLTAYYFLKEFFRQESVRRKQQVMMEKIRITLPLRMQAYERLILFLERISPGQLVMRSFRPGLAVREMQRMMVGNIREEYSHNMSQQLYVSSLAWKVISDAREEMIKQINVVAESMEEGEDANLFSERLLEASQAETMLRNALEQLKQEARKNF